VISSAYHGDGDFIDICDLPEQLQHLGTGDQNVIARAKAAER